MRQIIVGLLACLVPVVAGPYAQDSGVLRGDAAAIADARAMVDRMGGEAIWRETSESARTWPARARSFWRHSAPSSRPGARP